MLVFKTLLPMDLTWVIWRFGLLIGDCFWIACVTGDDLGRMVV